MINNRIIKQVYQNFRCNFKAVILFEMIYKLLALLIIVPFNYFVLQGYMDQVGLQYINHTNILEFIFSLSGLLSIVCILVISFIAIFIEIAVLIYIADKGHKGQKAHLLEGMIHCIRILPKKISKYHVVIVLMIGIIGPLTGLGLYNAMIKQIVVPDFIQEALFKSWQGKIVFTVSMIALCMILVRWILALPIFITKDVTLAEAFKESIGIYKESKYKLIGAILLWGTGIWLLRVTIILVYIGIGTVTLMFLKPFEIMGTVFVVLYLLLFLAGKSIISLIMLPLFIIFLIEIYNGYSHQAVIERVVRCEEHYKESRIYHLLVHYKKTATQIVLTLFITLVIGTAVAIVGDSVINKKIDVTAHRGSSIKAPENSISAVRLAIEEQADYVEIDVMLTKDEEVVLFHDTTLKRISGSDEKIKDMTLEQVKKVDNGSYFSSVYKGETIPTLKEVLQLAKGKVKLNIELKPVGNGDLLAEKVAQIIKSYGMEEEVVVSSLDYKCIEAFINQEINVRTGYIVSLGVGHFSQLPVDFISVEYGLLTEELVYDMHLWGKEVHVWTINDPEKVRDVARLRVDNIITDSVEMVKDEVNKLKSKKEINKFTLFYYSVFLFNRYLEI